MSAETRNSVAAVRGYHSLDSIAAPITFALFVGAFLTDLAFWLTADIMWERFSVWLLPAGLVMAVVAAIGGFIDLLRGDKIRGGASGWLFIGGNVLAFGLSLLNAFVHGRDAYTAVVPWGLALSALVVVILLLTVWIGRDRIPSHQVQVLQ